MRTLHKLTNNILSRDAIRVLGWSAYLRMVGAFAWRLPAIAAAGDLRPLDRSMGGTTHSFRYRGTALRFDCSLADGLVDDGTYAFGAVREILIRNCYLRHLPADVLGSIDTVVDLGANRGMFTTLAATFARRVLSIEPNPAFRPIIEHNLRINGFEHVTIEAVVVGEGGTLARSRYPRESLTRLLDRHGLGAVDLLKIDIEGSEFALFETDDWVSRVHRLCMEVHRRYGRPERIAGTLSDHGFTLAFADGDLRPVDPGRDFEFLYAWR